MLKSPAAVGARGLALALGVAVALASACTAAHNYLDPEGPRYLGSGGAPLAARTSIRVVSFNIAYAEKLDAALAALRSQRLREADILALQEMDAPGVEALACSLSMNYVYFPASRHPRTHRDFGNAILSPWPIEGARKLVLPGRARVIHQARAATVATVRLGSGPVTVYSVHLTSMWGMGGEGRDHQAEALIADAGLRPGPVVMAGDFNSKGVGHRYLEHGWLWSTREAGPSAGPFAFDHIFARGLRLHEATSVGVDRSGPKASDHWPVWAVLVDDSGKPDPTPTH